MKICSRSYYSQKPLFGSIRATAYKGKEPIEYELKLYSEIKGHIKLEKVRFKTLESAKGIATLHGYQVFNWDDHQCEA